jgi:hypothetical protein
MGVILPLKRKQQNRDKDFESFTNRDINCSIEPPSPLDVLKNLQPLPSLNSERTQK